MEPEGLITALVSIVRHRILTCKNHPELRWSCKDIAWSGFYNGCRSIFFNGVSTGKMFSDGSGLECNHVDKDGKYILECKCPASDLILAPEDALVKEYTNEES